jgi:threonine dehydratase
MGITLPLTHLIAAEPAKSKPILKSVKEGMVMKHNDCKKFLKSIIAAVLIALCFPVILTAADVTADNLTVNNDATVAGTLDVTGATTQPSVEPSA